VISDIRQLIRHWPLIRFLVMTRRRASVFGMLLGRMWFLLNPISQVAIYYFLVVVVFRAGPRQGISPFILIMLGVMHFGFLQQSISTAGNSVLQREKLLLQLNIPPIVFVAASFYYSIRDFVIALAVYYCAHLWIGPPLGRDAWWYPVILMVLIVFAWSCSLLIATLAVFFRDLRNVTQVVMRILMYLSPVLYTVQLVPEQFRTLYLLNPIGCIFCLLQWCALGTSIPPAAPIVTMLLVTVVMLVSAHVVYARLSPHFTKAI
jgi:ABC-type polysaccharide/polyol phosphate export permease